MTTKWWRRKLGVTLIEIILVLAIGSMFAVLGLRMYMTYRKQADIDTVKYNVDVLFQAMTRYFQANCNTAQFNNPSSAVISISPTVLSNSGYLTQNLLRDGLADYSSGSIGQYITQFNRITVGGAAPPQRMINLSPSGTRTMGSITLWTIQVSVNLADQSSLDAMLGPLGGDCINGPGPSYVRPCSMPVPRSPGFIVWTRIPSLSSSKNNSPLWQTMPAIKQFRQMYTTDPILILLQNPVVPNQLSKQYYNCGN